MKLRILLAAFVAAPLAAMAQPADQPQANPNPTTNRYVPEADFFKLPPGRDHGFFQRGRRRFPRSYLGGGPLRGQ